MASPVTPPGASSPDPDDGWLDPAAARDEDRPETLVLPSEVRRAASRRRRSRRATARAGRAVKRRVSDLFGAGGPAFRMLANAHAASTAGDTLIAIALANSLFFSVPSSEARGNVALYLLLTVAPFAVIGPLLGKVFDLPGAERRALVGASLVRVVAAVLLLPLADTFWLFPLAFTLLVLSRVHGISRSALLPQALSNPIALVTANARLAQVSVIGGAGAAVVGTGLAVIGPQAVLVASALFFAVATWQSLALPDLEDAEPEDGGSRPPTTRPLPLHTTTPFTARLRRPAPGDVTDPEGMWGVTASGSGPVPDPPTVPALSAQLRLARLATAVVRLLNGFLVLVLAFAFRDVDAPVADFGAVLAAAGGGYALASIAAPRLERSLREEPMVVAALAVEAAAAFITGQFFSLATAAFLSLAAGYAWGTAKFAYDGLLQATVEPVDRGRAFTNSETWFQLAWVLGAFLPTGLAIDVRIGLIVAGITALTAQTMYVSRLLQRRV